MTSSPFLRYHIHLTSIYNINSKICQYYYFFKFIYFKETEGKQRANIYICSIYLSGYISLLVYFCFFSCIPVVSIYCMASFLYLNKNFAPTHLFTTVIVTYATFLYI